MKKNIYVMIDTVTGNSGELFTMENDASVLRTMSHTLEEVKEANKYVFNMMRDTNIYCIGTFDSETSPMIEPISPARFVGSGASLISGFMSENEDGES